MKLNKLREIDDDKNKEISKDELLDSILDGSLDESDELNMAVEEYLMISNNLTDSFYDVLEELQLDVSLDLHQKKIVADMYESLSTDETLESMWFDKVLDMTKGHHAEVVDSEIERNTFFDLLKNPTIYKNVRILLKEKDNRERFYWFLWSKVIGLDMKPSLSEMIHGLSMHNKHLSLREKALLMKELLDLNFRMYQSERLRSGSHAKIASSDSRKGKSPFVRYINKWTKKTLLEKNKPSKKNTIKIQKKEQDMAHIHAAIQDHTDRVFQNKLSFLMKKVWSLKESYISNISKENQYLTNLLTQNAQSISDLLKKTTGTSFLIRRSHNQEWWFSPLLLGPTGIWLPVVRYISGFDDKVDDYTQEINEITECLLSHQQEIEHTYKNLQQLELKHKDQLRENLSDVYKLFIVWRQIGIKKEKTFYVFVSSILLQSGVSQDSLNDEWLFPWLNQYIDVVVDQEKKGNGFFQDRPWIETMQAPWSAPSILERVENPKYQAYIEALMVDRWLKSHKALAIEVNRMAQHADIVDQIVYHEQIDSMQDDAQRNLLRSSAGVDIQWPLPKYTTLKEKYNREKYQKKYSKGLRQYEVVFPGWARTVLRSSDTVYKHIKSKKRYSQWREKSDNIILMPKEWELRLTDIYTFAKDKNNNRVIVPQSHIEQKVIYTYTPNFIKQSVSLRAWLSQKIKNDWKLMKIGAAAQQMSSLTNPLLKFATFINWWWDFDDDLMNHMLEKSTQLIQGVESLRNTHKSEISYAKKITSQYVNHWHAWSYQESSLIAEMKSLDQVLAHIQPGWSFDAFAKMISRRENIDPDTFQKRMVTDGIQIVWSVAAAVWAMAFSTFTFWGWFLVAAWAGAMWGMIWSRWAQKWVDALVNSLSVSQNKYHIFDNPTLEDMYQRWEISTQTYWTQLWKEFGMWFATSALLIWAGQAISGKVATLAATWWRTGAFFKKLTENQSWINPFRKQIVDISKTMPNLWANSMWLKQLMSSQSWMVIKELGEEWAEAIPEILMVLATQEWISLEDMQNWKVKWPKSGKMLAQAMWYMIALYFCISPTGTKHVFGDDIDLAAKSQKKIQSLGGALQSTFVVEWSYAKFAKKAKELYTYDMWFEIVSEQDGTITFQKSFDNAPDQILVFEQNDVYSDNEKSGKKRLRPLDLARISTVDAVQPLWLDLRERRVVDDRMTYYFSCDQMSYESQEREVFDLQEYLMEEWYLAVYQEWYLVASKPWGPDMRFASPHTDTSGKSSIYN